MINGEDMMMQNVELYCGDCLEVMKKIPDSSIDMILTDLPYGVLNRSNPMAKWDDIIPLEPLWTEYRRIQKKNAAIILFGQGMFTAALMMSQPKLWRYNLIWEKDRPTGFLNANKMPLRSHEDILVFYDKLPKYNPQMIPCKPSERCHPIGNGKHTDINQHYGNFNRTHPQTIRDEKFPKSVIHVPTEHKCDGKRHPTQKPVKLCEWLIRTYTDKGDLVLDSCMGSGSTGIQQRNTGRRFIGIEKEQKYYELQIERMGNVNCQIDHEKKGMKTLDDWI